VYVCSPLRKGWAQALVGGVLHRAWQASQVLGQAKASTNYSEKKPSVP
jgi:hypothetical protein